MGGGKEKLYGNLRKEPERKGGKTETAKLKGEN